MVEAQLGLIVPLYKADRAASWHVSRRFFARLAANATPVRNDAPKTFASTYENFIQTAGIGMVLPLRQASLGVL